MRRSTKKSAPLRLPSRSEAFALIWFLCFPLMILFDGDVIRLIGLFPTMGWDQALKYYYIALCGVEALLLLLYGFVFSDRQRRSRRSRGRRVYYDYTR